MKVKLILSIAILFLFLSSVSVIYSAKKVLPRFRTAGRTAAKSGKTTGSVVVSAKLRSDRKGLIVYFKNLNLATSVNYNLSYMSSGESRGVMGTLDTQGKYSLSRELLFGTCSSGVCRYDTQITDGRFEVTSNLKSGRRAIKRFRIKV